MVIDFADGHGIDGNGMLHGDNYSAVASVFCS
jgi:hypothetical protein